MNHTFSPPTTAWLKRGRHLEVNGHQVFVVDAGRGPALLLLHGFPTSSYDWRGMMDLATAAGWRAVALDFLGYGLSDKPAAFSYSLFQQADVVEEIGRRLQLADVHVVSHDVGTSVHCELLARQAEGRLSFSIASSCLLNGSVLQWMATITPFQELLSSNATLPQAIELCHAGLAMYLPGLKGIMQRPESLSADDELVMTELLRYQDGHRRLPALAVYMRERYINRDRWLGALEATDRPLGFVWADGDPIANLALGRELHRMYPSAYYEELQGLGHFLLIEDPLAVWSAVSRFFKG